MACLTSLTSRAASPPPSPETLFHLAQDGVARGPNPVFGSFGQRTPKPPGCAKLWTVLIGLGLFLGLIYEGFEPSAWGTQRPAGMWAEREERRRMSKEMAPPTISQGCCTSFRRSRTTMRRIEASRLCHCACRKQIVRWILLL